MTAPGGRHLVTAHHAWAWHREAAEPPLVPARTPTITDASELAETPWPPPPPPAPGEEQILALIADAAAQARSHLLVGTPLECARTEDTVRLAAAVPRARMSEIAERIGMDIADLRSRIRAQEQGTTSNATR